MKVIVKHDRDDKGWIVTRDGQFATATDKIYTDLFKALAAARSDYPYAELCVDTRTHSKLGNGMVITKDIGEILPVEWK